MCVDLNCTVVLVYIHVCTFKGIIVTASYDAAMSYLFFVNDPKYVDTEPFTNNTRSLLLDGILTNIQVDKKPKRATSIGFAHNLVNGLGRVVGDSFFDQLHTLEDDWKSSSSPGGESILFFQNVF